MRSIATGILATALYTLALASLIGMAMPTEARIQAYLESAREVAVSATAAEPLDPIAG